MQYTVTDPFGAEIAAGTASASGITVASLSGFNAAVAGPYTIETWCADAGEQSVHNVREFWYKGVTVAAFKYNDSSRPFASFYDETGMFAYNTSGGDVTTTENRSKLSMYPNGSDATPMTYTNTYGVRVSRSNDNVYTATKNLDHPNGNGYWLIETSTAGYRDLTLTLEQLSSSKGPRDWALAYSVNGLTYTYIDGSNVRAISNDAYGEGVETYNNIRLPAACNDKNKLYLKVFINGGETLEGTELDDPSLTKGNTGINNIEINGIPTQAPFAMSVTTVLLENPNGSFGNTAIDSPVRVNGVNITGDGSETVSVNAGDTVTVIANRGKTFERTITFVANANQPALTVPVVGLDSNQDGIINAKDYAAILQTPDSTLKTKCLAIFEDFLNETEQSVTY